MGKPTGFLEYERKGNKEITPLERIKNFNEFHVPTRRERNRQPDVWIVVFRFVNPA